MQCLYTEKSLTDLGETLQVLAAPETRSLAKALHLGPRGPGGGGSSGSTKEDLVQAILKHSCKANISSFFAAPSKPGGSNNNTAIMILKRQVYLHKFVSGMIALASYRF